jgi:general secretion pathway protein D
MKISGSSPGQDPMKQTLPARLLTLLLAFAATLAAGPALVPVAAAQEPGAPPAAATSAVNPVITPAGNRSNGPLITPNYKDADLGQIVEAVSQVTGKNFIVDPRAKAQVTMLSATPMSPEAFYEAFLSILQVHGFVAVPSGRVWKIIPDANARQVPANDLPDKVSSSSDEIVTQVLQVRNVSAAQLVPILRPLIPQYGHLAAYPSSNILIISDRANNVNRLTRIIKRIDQGGDEDIDVIRLEHASAAEVVRVVNSLAAVQAGAEGGGVKLVADERTNSVLLSGESGQRLRLKALVTHLDTPLEAGGDTQVRYLRYSDAEKIAVKLKEQLNGLQSSGGGTPTGPAASRGEGGTTIWADPETNALVVTAPPKIMRSLMSVVDRLDIRRAQVLVEAIIVEVSGDKNVDLGVNWILDGSSDNIAAGGFVSPIGGTSIGDIARAIQSPSTITSVPTGMTIGVGRFKDGGTNFGAILRAIRGDARTNIISTPSIITLDNQEAQIKVAQEVPFITGQFTNTGSGGSNGSVNPFQTIQRQEVGTILKVTPQITDDGTIVMKIEQEASSLAASSAGAADLITNKRTISTKVLADDGEVIVLGGLISDSLTDGEQPVPYLGRVPLLGELFRTRNAKKNKTNLMVFIRPKILMDGDQVAAETEAKYNYLRGIQTGRTKGRAPMLPGERQPTLPAMEQLSPPAAPTKPAAPATAAAPATVTAPVANEVPAVQKP